MTPPFTRIICLANSWKHGERCIAGIDLFTGRWVRPVANTDDGRVPKDVRIVGGVEPALLDILDIPLAETGPDYGFECENRAILPGPWRWAGRASPKDVARYCLASGPILHAPGRTVTTECLRALPSEQRISLALVRTVSFSVRMRPEGSEKVRWEGCLQTRDGQRLTATITDPVFVGHLEAGYRPGDQCFVVVSLSVPYPSVEGGAADTCWKLIAGVVDLAPVTWRVGPVPSPKPAVFTVRGSAPIWLSPDGREMVAGVEPRPESVSTMSFPLRGLNTWNVAPRRKIRTAPLAGEPTGPAAIRADGKLVARQCNSAVQLIRPCDNGRVGTLTPMPRTVTALVFRRDSDDLVIASSESSPQGLAHPELGVWNVSRRALRRALPQPPGLGGALGVTSLCSSLDGRRIAGVIGCREQDVVCLWDAEGTLLGSVSATRDLGGLGTVSCLAFDPPGTLLAVGSWDGSVTVWETERWSLAHVFHAPTRSIVDAVAFSPGGRWFAYGTGSHPGYQHVFERDGAVLIDWARRREIATLGHHDIVSGLAFSDDETTLATFSIDGVVKAWTLPDCEGWE
jgi:WD40 repeat protein